MTTEPAIYRSDADALDRACEILERDGWGKGFYTNNLDGTHCAVGAVIVAVKEQYAGLATGYRHAARWRLERRLQDKIGLPYGEDQAMCVETWNDQTERTLADVIELFKLTAKDIRNEVAAA